MAYQMYRSTTLGKALQETLDELIQEGQITPALALRVITTYDKAINKALAQRIKTKVVFKANHLKAYRFCDNVWTFLMENVDFRESSNEMVSVDQVKIVACDGKVAGSSTSTS